MTRRTVFSSESEKSRTPLFVWHAGSVTSPQARPPMVAAVLEVARRQLGEVGPAALSLRAIARELGVVPSALYRYLPGREAILTALITEGYSRLAAAVEAAESAVDPTDHLGRWCTVWSAARAWAVTHRHEYALLYGTPVVGYRAPSETVLPATRVVAALARVVLDARAAGQARTPTSNPVPEMREDAEAILHSMADLNMPAPGDAGPDLVLTVIEAWTTLFGAISFELFGHYVGSIRHGADYHHYLAVVAAQRAGLVPHPGSPDRSRKA